MDNQKKPLEFYLIITLFSALIILCFLQVLFRFLLNLPLAWTEELSRYVFIILIYAGASAAALGNAHVRVELIDNWLSPKAKWIFDIVVRAICMGMSLMIAYYFTDVIKNAIVAEQLSASLQVPMWIVYALVSVMFALIAFRFAQCGWKTLRAGPQKKKEEQE